MVTLVLVRYWDHCSTDELEDIPNLQEAVGFWDGLYHWEGRGTFMRLAMHRDLSFPFMVILASAIEEIRLVPT